MGQKKPIWRMKGPGCEIAVMDRKPYGPTHEYQVVLARGEWPNDQDLVTALDNGGFRDLTQCHFGGYVLKKDNTATVRVYVD